jgi:hypothetical protein
MMRAGRLDIDEDRVVLGRPPPARLGAVVIGPDDLIEKRVTPEQLVEQQLAVMGLAVVDVEVERPVRGQQLADAGQARLQEAEVVAERVVVTQRAQQFGPVAPAPEADPFAAGVVGRGQRPPRLSAAGVEPMQGDYRPPE